VPLVRELNAVDAWHYLEGRSRVIIAAGPEQASPHEVV
jgi:hypothetical protein